MLEFWRLYKRGLKGYPDSLIKSWGATVELFGALLLITFPVSFLILYPLVALWRKVKP